jgi:hypothetical protein
MDSFSPTPPQNVRSIAGQDKSGAYLLSELPGIAVSEVGFPALERVDDICQFNLTFGVISLQLPEPPPRPSQVFCPYSKTRE